MILTVIRTRVRPELADEYQAEFDRMWQIAEQQPGFISRSKFMAEDGEALSLQEWESLEHLQAWRDHPAHVEIKKRGRAEFYQDYTIHICAAPQTYGFTRDRGKEITRDTG